MIGEGVGTWRPPTAGITRKTGYYWRAHRDDLPRRPAEGHPIRQLPVVAGAGAHRGHARRGMEARVIAARLGRRRRRYRWSYAVTCSSATGAAATREARTATACCVIACVEEPIWASRTPIRSLRSRLGSQLARDPGVLSWQPRSGVGYPKLPAPCCHADWISTPARRGQLRMSGSLPTEICATSDRLWFRSLPRCSQHMGSYSGVELSLGSLQVLTLIATQVGQGRTPRWRGSCYLRSRLLQQTVLLRNRRPRDRR